MVILNLIKYQYDVTQNNLLFITIQLQIINYNIIIFYLLIHQALHLLV